MLSRERNPRYDMKRQQLFDRNEFDFEDKKIILQKSGGVCARCGKPIIIGKNATVDHFIPISKGGINQKLNIIPLCKACNKAKSNKIIDPENYIKYLKPQHIEELTNYYNSYIHSFEYIKRSNLMCCDQYILQIYSGPSLKNIKKPEKRKDIYKRFSQYFTLERSIPSDIPDLNRFFIEYLDHYDILDSPETAEKNIEFWRRFGVVYFIKDRDGNIRFMIPITVAKWNDNEHFLNTMIFSRYSTDSAVRILMYLPYYLSRTIMSEQELPYLRFRLCIHRNDNLWHYMEGARLDPGCSWACADNIYMDDLSFDVNSFKEKEHPFYQQFKTIRKFMDEFFAQDGYRDIDNMGSMIIPGYPNDQTQKNNND